MDFNQRQQAVVNLVIGGDLQAARAQATKNEAIFQDEIAAFTRSTDELNAMLGLAAVNRGPLPQLIIGSSLYQAV